MGDFMVRARGTNFVRLQSVTLPGADMEDLLMLLEPFGELVLEVFGELLCGLWADGPSCFLNIPKKD
jgi:hypothetical protein